MPLIEWNEELRLGNACLDGHHQHLVELLNLAHDSFVFGMQAGELARTINALADYANYHFAEEELFMREHSYPALADHLREHDAFRCKIAEMLEKHTGDHHPAYLEITDFLLEWLICHIKTADRAIFTYLEAETHSNG